jgi:hypothetical protein
MQLTYIFYKDTKMKFKLLASSVLMAGALMGSGAASADVSWYWSGSQADWAGVATGIVDRNPPFGTPPGTSSSGNPSGDGDTTFTFINNSIANPLSFTLSEQEVNGVDFYKVDGTWVAATSGSLEYKISTTDGDGLNMAALDTSISGTATTHVIKNIYSDAGFTNLLATFDSLDSARDPLNVNEYKTFANYQTLYVRDTITAGTVTSISNEFTVPEPMTLVMLGLGLVGFGYSRRGAKGLSA